jgi:hypothetical protein
VFLKGNFGGIWPFFLLCPKSVFKRKLWGNMAIFIIISTSVKSSEHERHGSQLSEKKKVLGQQKLHTVKGTVPQKSV